MPSNCQKIAGEVIAVGQGKVKVIVFEGVDGGLQHSPSHRHEQTSPEPGEKGGGTRSAAFIHIFTVGGAVRSTCRFGDEGGGREGGTAKEF